MECHLGWYEKLFIRTFSGSGHWFNLAYDEYTLDVIGGSLHELSLVRPKIPYALDPIGGIYFEDWNYIRSDGLTCSNFVIVVLEHLGFMLLDRGSWMSRPADAERNKELLDKLVAENRPIDAYRQTQYLNNVRFRPEEVAASAAEVSQPVPFAIAERLGIAAKDFLMGGGRP